MNNWEYLFVPLVQAEAQPVPDGAAATERLNQQGLLGWEAVGLTVLGNGHSAVLMKRPLAQTRSSGGRM